MYWILLILPILLEKIWWNPAETNKPFSTAPFVSRCQITETPSKYATLFVPFEFWVINFRNKAPISWEALDFWMPENDGFLCLFLTVFEFLRKIWNFGDTFSMFCCSALSFSWELPEKFRAEHDLLPVWNEECCFPVGNHTQSKDI